MAYERCHRADCAHPSEMILVVVIVDLVAADPMEGARHLPLCRHHAQEALAALEAE